MFQNEYAAMKLSGQTSQYWTNLKNRHAARGQSLINTWDRMKEELKTKYVPPSFSVRLIDNWHQTLMVTNLPRGISRKSMNSSSDVVPSIRKEKIKFFLDLEPTLEMMYELNC